MAGDQTTLPPAGRMLQAAAKKALALSYRYRSGNWIPAFLSELKAFSTKTMASSIFAELGETSCYEVTLRVPRRCHQMDTIVAKMMPSTAIAHVGREEDINRRYKLGMLGERPSNQSRSSRV